MIERAGNPKMITTNKKRTCIADVSFDVVTMREAVQRILLMIQKAAPPCYVCTGNLDHLVLLNRDETFRKIYREADLVLADGMPVVWLSKLSGGEPLTERVAGSDLFWELGQVSEHHGITLFFLGGAPGSAERAAEAMRAKYPNVHISGIYCPPLDTFDSPEEQVKIRETIRKASPDVLFVGLGAPKQEKWIAEHRDDLGVPVSIGVGGTFEMAGGIVMRAPTWMQRAGLEWLFRLMQDPKRLWRRYIMKDFPYLVKLTVQTLTQRMRRRRTHKMTVL
jgi:N-acetylglucosaminyldiphosphoundecaprenol N-acetyl-beta-D-mannosaminyltransferase